MDFRGVLLKVGARDFIDFLVDFILHRVRASLRGFHGDLALYNKQKTQALC